MQLKPELLFWHYQMHWIGRFDFVLKNTVLKDVLGLTTLLLFPHQAGWQAKLTVVHVRPLAAMWELRRAARQGAPALPRYSPSGPATQHEGLAACTSLKNMAVFSTYRPYLGDIAVI